ncbi:MAG: glycosyltransferase family 4 protein [Pseudomonadota bacterium]
MTKQRTRVLYLQHSASLGGSCKSLLYTLQALDLSRYEPIVALTRPNDLIATIYENAGFQTIRWPGIGTFEHTTAHWCPVYSPICWHHNQQLLRYWKTSLNRTQQLLHLTQPHLVHLNSAVLVQAARMLKMSKTPFVWHIREHPVTGHFGLRKRWLSFAIQNWPDAAIFISKADQHAWAHKDFGVVIPNFVNLSEFSRKENERKHARQNLNLPNDIPVILYMGGLTPVKGIFVLFQALAQLKNRLPNMRCIMPDSVYQPTGRWQSNLARTILPLVGTGTLAQQADRMITDLGLGNICLRLPPQNNIVPSLAAADLLVFPALEPHFARPVIEAAAMNIPSVASDLDGTNELVIPQKTGLLVPPGNSNALASAIFALFSDENQRMRMGNAAREHAVKIFDANKSVKRIEALYEQIISRASTQ